MDFSNIFRLVNLAIGVVVVLGGVSQFFYGGSNIIHNVVLGVYTIVFGLAIAVLELVPQVPPYLPKYASFLFSFLGRGVFYIFLGTLLLDHGVLRILAGTIVSVVGLGYCVLEFAPQIEPPSNMRDADAGWGAEQV